MAQITSEILGIDTVYALRAVLLAYPDDMPIGDAFGEALKLEVLEDTETGEKTIAVS